MLRLLDVEMNIQTDHHQEILWVSIRSNPTLIYGDFYFMQYVGASRINFGAFLSIMVQHNACIS
jgi:hypothetical protein